MSGSETDTSKLSDKKSNKKDENFKKLEISEIAELEKPKILDYVDFLHSLLKKKEKYLKKYKQKVRKLIKQLEKLKSAKNKKENETSDEAAPKESDPEKTAAVAKVGPENDQQTASTASFVDEIRQAAEQAQSLSDFVYEPTSGLYYDQKTGYYYNAEYGLYYDGHTGCYYKYNQEKNSFEFHSQVAVQPNQQAEKNANNGNGNGGGGGDKKADDDDLMDDVQFDEHGGVITDVEKLRKLRKEKRRKQRELEKAKRKKKKSKHAKDKKSKKQSSKRAKKSKRLKKNKSAVDDDEDNSDLDTNEKNDMEDGELSESSSSTSSSSCTDNESDNNEKSGEEKDVPLFKSAGRFQDIAKKYPPSLRIIVQETNIDSLKVGSLSLITFKGGSLGREGDHDVIIPDVNVSKSHLTFSYDRKVGLYKCVDLGSQNGTILNGARMSKAKQASEPFDLVHGSVIQIGQTKLLCHTHEGNSTCGLCEPGLLIEQATSEKDAPLVHLSHKEQLKKLQKKYGLENEKFVDGSQGNANNNYKDRAATRRIKVGSSSGNEKTQAASVLIPISSENKGFKMLSKLGWSEGEALGKSQASGGLIEPINVAANEGKKGLGCEEVVAATKLTKAEKKKMEAFKKMQERYKNTTDIFTLSDDSG